MMVQIELGLSNVVTSSRLTCSSCNRTLSRADTNISNGFSDENFVKAHLKRVCIECIQEDLESPIMTYHVKGKRYERCRSCEEFIEHESMPSSKVLRKWIRRNAALLDCRDVGLTETACEGCFDEWKEEAIEAKDEYLKRIYV